MCSPARRTSTSPRSSRGLDELWRRGIIREQGTDAYDFAHGKIRDVAYEALSVAARRRNHRRIAAALPKLRHRDVEAVSGEVARHYDLGGDVDDAVAWYERAAVQARRLDANVEAVRLLDRAEELLALLPDGADRRAREMKVLSALATPLAVVDGFASARLATTQGRVLDLAAASGVDPEPSLLRSLAMTRLCRDDFDGARDVATRLRGLAERVGDDLLLVETDYLLGIGAFWDGAFDAAREHFERVAQDFDPARRGEHLLRFGHDPVIVCCSRLANTLWFLGRTADARRARDEAVAMARDVGHPFSRGATHAFAATLAADLDEVGPFREYATALGADAQYGSLYVAGEVFLGYADVLDGRAAEGIGRTRAALDDRPLNHAPGQRAVHLRLLVAAYQAAGTPRAAWRRRTRRWAPAGRASGRPSTGSCGPASSPPWARRRPTSTPS